MKKGMIGMSTLSAYIEHDSHELPRRNLKVGLWMDGSFDWYAEEDMMSHPEGGIRTLLQTFTRKTSYLFKDYDQKYVT